MTDKHVYKLDAKTFKIHKTPIELAALQGFAISSCSSNVRPKPELVSFQRLQVIIMRMTVGDLAMALDGMGHVTEMIVALFKTTGKTCVDTRCRLNISSRCTDFRWRSATRWS